MCFEPSHQVHMSILHTLYVFMVSAFIEYMKHMYYELLCACILCILDIHVHYS